MNYNLLDEHWIPVLYNNGRSDRVGVCKVLKDARTIRQIAASNPMDRVALLRFLIALLLWCKADTKTSLAMLGEKSDDIPDDWLAKLKEHRTAFNLLGDGPRFYQDLNAEPPDVGASNLIHEFPSGSKIAHFRHIRDDRDGLCMGCCALALVRWSVLASAGTAGAGQSMTASLNGNTPAYTIYAEQNLFDTLKYELKRLTAVNGDQAVWDSATEKSTLGPLKAFTWRSRSILIQQQSETRERNHRESRCSYCGEESTQIVYKIRFRPGWKRPSNAPWADDPHLLRITVDKGRQIIPTWPSPNEALEHHTYMWTSIIQGILQQTNQQRSVKRNTVLVASAQALYKHIATHELTMPAFDQAHTKAILSELDWVRRATWSIISARTGKGKMKEKVWGKTPKGHAIFEILHGPKSLGHEIRSSLCELSAQTYVEMEKCFRELLRQYDVKRWRQSIRAVITRTIEQVVCSTTPGSPLRRRETLARARSSLESALMKVEKRESPTSKAVHTSDTKQVEGKSIITSTRREAGHEPDR